MAEVGKNGSLCVTYDTSSGARLPAAFKSCTSTGADESSKGEFGKFFSPSTRTEHAFSWNPAISCGRGVAYPLNKRLASAIADAGRDGFRSVRRTRGTYAVGCRILHVRRNADDSGASGGRSRCCRQQDRLSARCCCAACRGTRRRVARRSRDGARRFCAHWCRGSGQTRCLNVGSAGLLRRIVRTRARSFHTIRGD